MESPLYIITKDKKESNEYSIFFLRFLFWSQVTWKIYEPPSGEIIRTDLSGAGQRIIVNENVGVVSGLTIDHERSMLYWADNYQTNIDSVDFDGNNRKVVLPALLVRLVINSVRLFLIVNI